MEHSKAWSLVAEICPNQAGLLWDTTDATGCDTANAVANQYADSEEDEARNALAEIARGEAPQGWERHVHWKDQRD